MRTTDGGRRGWSRPAHEIAAVIALAGLLALAGCGGGGGGATSTPPPAPVLSASPTALVPNLVVLGGSPAGSSQFDLQVLIGGPTTSTDIYAFSFTILLGDPSLVQIMNVTAGNALTGTLQAQASIVGDRIVVGVSKTGPVAGNGVTTANAIVVHIMLRTLHAGSTALKFAGTSPSTSAADAQAVDSTLTRIPSITFDAGTATLTQG